MTSLIDSLKGWFRKLKGKGDKSSGPLRPEGPVIGGIQTRRPRPEEPRRSRGEEPRKPRVEEARKPRSREEQRPQHRSRTERPASHTARHPKESQRPERRQPRHSQAPPPQPPPAPLREPAVPPAPPWDPATYVIPPEAGKTRFHDLQLPSQVMHALADLGFQYCTPVQAEILPSALKGMDATGRAQTGTGKTAAFLLTIFTQLLRNPAEGQRKPGTPRALILAPTRELVMQIEKDAVGIGKYCTELRVLAVYGGTDYAKQRRMLERGTVDVIVATPGRLLDFKSKGGLMLSKVEVLVIDEADRMLDMGFIPDVRRIIESTPPKTRRQTLLFSATLTPDVVRLASKWTKDAITIEIDPEQVSSDSVDQVVYIVTAEEKFKVLYNMITGQKLDRVLVFCNRRDESQRLAERFAALGVSTGLLSGDVSQDRRIKTLEAFRSGSIRVMVATDVAARGLHIEDISHVINYNLPLNAEDYVHRIGRTGRAGATGTSVSFADEMDAQQIPAIEGYIGKPLTGVYPGENLLVEPVALQDKPAPLIIEMAARPQDRRRGRGRFPHSRGGRRGPGGGQRRQGGSGAAGQGS